MFSLAALYPASTRLMVAVVVLALFGVLAPKRSPRPLALAVISVIVAGWLFGATLVWGTGRGSRFPSAAVLSALYGAPLLGLAVLGALCSGGALRAFAYEKRRLGWALATVFAVTFAGWSALVRYSVIAAVVVLASSVGALVFASTPPRAPAASGTAQALNAAGARASRVLGNFVASPLLSGFAFYWWLRWSPKSLVDPACGLPAWVALTFVPFIVVPGIVASLGARRAGRSREAAAAIAVGVTAVTVSVCFVAFLMWFGLNRCGE
jgi:hypothetical protein